VHIRRWTHSSCFTTFAELAATTRLRRANLRYPVPFLQAVISATVCLCKFISNLPRVMWWFDFLILGFLFWCVNWTHFKTGSFFFAVASALYTHFIFQPTIYFVTSKQCQCIHVVAIFCSVTCVEQCSRFHRLNTQYAPCAKPSVT